MIEMAIVGLGSWGLCVLERTVSRARRIGHLGPPARGRTRPARWWGLRHGAARLPGAQQRLRAALAVRLPRRSRPAPPTPSDCTSGRSSRGYRWVGYECRIGTEGEPIQATDYLPRRLMGEYLDWFYDTLVADAPPNLEIVRHWATAVDISPEIGGREAVLLDNGKTLSVDHVVLTSGHTWNDEPEGDQRGALPAPVPGRVLRRAAPPGSSIAVAGMGLVASTCSPPSPWGGGGPSRTWGTGSATCPPGRSRSSPSTPDRACPTAPSRPTASIPTASTSRWCAPPRSSPR